MKIFILVVSTVILAAITSEPQECYVEELTMRGDNIIAIPRDSTQFHAQYGAIARAEADLQRYANSLLYKSFDLLSLSIYYDNYIKNLIGFDHLFLNMSNTLWDSSMDTIKYITFRGGRMSFANADPEDLLSEVSAELYELHSIARALDIQKSVAKKAVALHRDVATLRSEKHDAEVAYYLKENHIEAHRAVVRDLTGYVTDLSGLFSGKDSALSRYLYNVYLNAIY
ncbi:ferritin light chain-like [Euwallacea fornicatus]|uniref:ferritin light chain-like n=1 Tax=Euwallacea fornicatus TaxID=995702 RepID=UPI00338DDDB7